MPTLENSEENIRNKIREIIGDAVYFTNQPDNPIGRITSVEFPDTIEDPLITIDFKGQIKQFHDYEMIALAIKEYADRYVK